MDKCKWYEDFDLTGDQLFETECDNTFALIGGTPEENEMKYCCYCGKELEQMLTPEKPVDL